MGTDDSGQQWEPFPETSWTAIGEVWAEGPDGPRHALGALLQRYMPALRARLVIEKGIAPDKAGDLLSGFTADKILERNLISRADRSRGRFRTFLLTALDRYVVDEHRAAAAEKRKPADGAVVSLNGLGDQELPRNSDDPSAASEVAWAREVLAEAIRRMEAQCRTDDRPELWEVFRCRVLDPALEGADPLPYDKFVSTFGMKTPVQAANALVTAKRLFARLLKSVVAEYADGAAADQEIADLRAILAGARR
jgi:DNA-directed RNA polymerase specialized sigma24 family protein